MHYLSGLADAATAVWSSCRCRARVTLHARFTSDHIPNTGTGSFVAGPLLVCETEKFSPSCQARNEVVHVTNALYGRPQVGNKSLLHYLLSRNVTWLENVSITCDCMPHVRGCAAVTLHEDDAYGRHTSVACRFLIYAPPKCNVLRH